MVSTRLLLAGVCLSSLTAAEIFRSTTDSSKQKMDSALRDTWPYWYSARNIMPRVVGHRGIPAIYPENTMISFEAALAAGADGIESDLHLTKDKVLVLIHDNTLQRTTNCSGYIGNYTLADLSSCNANYPSVFGDKYGFVPIPTFESVVQLVVKYQAFFVLDLKENALLGQYIRPVVDKYSAASLMAMSCWTFDQVVDAVQYMNTTTRQFLNDTAWGLTGQPGSAFYDATTTTTTTLASSAAQGMDAKDAGLPMNASLALWEQYASLGVRAFSLGAPSLTPTFVNQAHSRLMPVFAWTVDDAPTINALIDIGVDGILTNNVYTLLAVVQQRANAALSTPDTSDGMYGKGAIAGAVIGTFVASLMLFLAVVRCRANKDAEKAKHRQPTEARLLDPSY